MVQRNTEFRTQTSVQGERVFNVRQESPDSFLLEERDRPAERPILLTTNERGLGVYEINMERWATPVEAAMLANAAFQSIVVENSLLDIQTNTFAIVGTRDFLKGHEHATLYEQSLGMAAVAMTRQGDEVIMLGGDAQEVNGNAAWTMHDANIFRVTE